MFCLRPPVLVVEVLGENVLADTLWETYQLELLLVRFLVELEVVYGVSGVNCCGLRAFGTVEAGVFRFQASPLELLLPQR